MRLWTRGTEKGSSDPLGDADLRSRVAVAAKPHQGDLSSRIGGTWRSAAEAARAFSASPVSKYVIAAMLYFASRGIIALGVEFGTLLRPSPLLGTWHSDNPWLDPLLRFDAGWYGSILGDGYQLAQTPGGESNVAFFPLYPLLAFVLKGVAHLDNFVALLAVSNAFALALPLLLVKLGTDRFGESNALYAVAIFCFFPMSFFLNSAYSESTSIVFVLMSLLALDSRRFLIAALLTGAAAGARSTGFALAPVVALAAWADSELPVVRRAAFATLCGILACSGLLLFMAYQYWAFGDPLAFVVAQSGWHQGALLTRVLRGLVLLPIFPIRIFRIVWFIAPLLIVVFNYRFLPRDLFRYGVLSLLIPYFTLGITPSAPRFLMMCAPLWFCLARWLRAAPLSASLVFAVSTTLLCLNSAKFSQWYWIG